MKSNFKLLTKSYHTHSINNITILNELHLVKKQLEHNNKILEEYIIKNSNYKIETTKIIESIHDKTNKVYDNKISIHNKLNTLQNDSNHISLLLISTWIITVYKCFTT